MLLFRSLKVLWLGALLSASFVSLTSAQDNRYGYRQPREMVQQAPQPRGFLEAIFGRREASPPPQVYYPEPTRPQRATRGRSERERVAARERIQQNMGNEFYPVGYIDPDRNAAPGDFYRNQRREVPRYFKASPESMRVKTKKHASAGKTGAVGTGIYCVRSCDGFFFPIANTRNVVDGRGAQQEACNTMCPGAEVEVYRSGSSTIDEAVNMSTRRNYKAHPKAYAFREKIDPNVCSCKGYGTRGLARIPYNKDYTLKMGDVILMDNGAHVFNGGDGYPYKNNDFVSAARSSSRLSADVRSMLVAKNVPIGNVANKQVASVGNIVSDAQNDIELLTAPSQKSVRLIDIVGKQKNDRPVLVIDIINQIKNGQRS